jgi:integrase
MSAKMNLPQHVRKVGKDYFLDYRFPPGRYGRRIRVKVGPRLDEATILLAERMKDIRQGRNPELREVKPILFSKMIEVYLERHASTKKSPSSFETSTNILKNRFGKKLLQGITVADIEDFKAARLEEDVENGTINRNLSILKGIFTCAGKWGMFGGENPAKKVELLEESPGRIRYLTPKEAEALLAKAKGHLRLAILIALHTGGRLSEVLKLTWSNVNLESGHLHYTKETTKSSKGRDIPIDPELDKALRAAREALRTARQAAGIIGDRNVIRWGKRDIERITTAFTKARKDAGLPAKGPDKVTFHTLRHTFASWFMMNGGDLYRLKGFMGHSDIKLTERYAHLSTAHQQAGVRFFGPPKAIGGQSVDTSGNGRESGSA